VDVIGHEAVCKHIQPKAAWYSHELKESLRSAVVEEKIQLSIAALSGVMELWDYNSGCSISGSALKIGSFRAFLTNWPPPN
jgi:hypothetical protein